MQSTTGIYAMISAMKYSIIPQIGLQLSQQSLHTGEFKWSCHSEDFGAWLLCDGRTLPKSSYPALSALLAPTGMFGSTSDSTTFVLPDARGRVMGIVGQGEGLTLRTIGHAVGEATHILQSNEMPVHYHSGSTSNFGGHAHPASADSNAAHTHAVTDPGHAHGTIDPGHAHGQWTYRGADGAYRNGGDNIDGMAPRWCSDTGSTFVTSAPGQNIQASSASISVISSNTGISTNPDGLHAHNVSMSTVADHQHAFTTDNTGGGASHSNVQPTLCVGNLFIYAGQ